MKLRVDFDTENAGDIGKCDSAYLIRIPKELKNELIIKARSNRVLLSEIVKSFLYEINKNYL